MVTRLLLGCGSVGHAVLDAAERLPGTTIVLDPDPGRVEALRNEKVAAEEVDVTDAAAIGGRDAETVVVAGDDAGVNHAATAAAVEAYPDATVLAYAGQHPTPAQREAVAEWADEVLRPGAYILDHVAPFLDTTVAGRGRALRRALESVDGTLGVVMHDNPDPDAIAAAVALVDLAERFGVTATACYHGEINHQENRAFVNLLELDLHQHDPEDPVEYDAVALVDHSRPGVNDQLDPDTPVDIVLDHHPGGPPDGAGFVDIRSDVGATATILTGYLRQFAVEPDRAVATALLYGIRVDTKDFTREIVPEDFEAAAYLLPHADTSVLERVESPSVSADTFDTIARAIKGRRIDGAALASCVGPIADRDTLAQAADRLLGMEGVTTTLVSGFDDGTIYLSARSRRPDFDIGEVLRTAFDELGSAGGHTDMAGAQLPMGLFEALDREDEDRLADVVETVVADRFFEAVRSDVGELEAEEEVVSVVRRVPRRLEDVDGGAAELVEDAEPAEESDTDPDHGPAGPGERGETEPGPEDGAAGGPADGGGGGTEGGLEAVDE